MREQKYRHAIFAIIYTIVKNKPQYLLLKRKLHWKGWEISKGGKRIYETDKMTLKRELKEETGLKIKKIAKKFRIDEKYKYDKKYSDRKGFVGQKYKTLFLVEVEKGKINLDNIEHSGSDWFEFSEAVKKLKWSNQRKLMNIFRGSLGDYNIL
ncbi:NUDIX domain-containing protein, partial [Nanoarchaeota archaeon]